MDTKKALFAKARDVARKWSFKFFNRIFDENVWDYTQNRFLPIVNMYTKQINGAVLDAACGFGNPYIEKSNLIKQFTVGIDVDPTVKEKNEIHQNFIIDDLHTLKSKQKFDIIFCLNTLEHLHTPQLVLKNFHNAIYNKGILIIIAPQRWHYVSIVERTLTTFLKDLAWRFLKGEKKMPFPAYYNLCSKSSLLSAANSIGFRVKHFSTIESPPIWLAVIPPLFLIMCLWMIVLNKFRLFESLRSTFIAVLKKE